MLCVESDDLPRDMDIVFFLSARAAPMGRIEGDGSGNAVLLALAVALLGMFLSETRFPILSGFVPLAALLAGTVLTEMFFPQPAELGSAEAILSDGVQARQEVHSQPRSSAAGLGQCDLMVKDGGATAACFCRASYSAGLVKLSVSQTSFIESRLKLTQSRNRPLRNNHYPLPTRAGNDIPDYRTSSPSKRHRSTASSHKMPSAPFRQRRSVQVFRPTKRLLGLHLPS